VGLLLLLPSALAASRLRLGPQTLASALLLFLAWLPAVLLTDKYRHKYPQRYLTYLLAQHGKAALLMGLFAALIRLVPGVAWPPGDAVLLGLAVFACLDLLISLPHRCIEPVLLPLEPAPPAGQRPPEAAGAVEIDTASILDRVDREADPEMGQFLRERLPRQAGRAAEVRVVHDVPPDGSSPAGEPAALLMGLTPLNDVRRLQRYLLFCSSAVSMGGYLAVRYVPLENAIAALRTRFPRALYWPARIAHFVWYRGLPKIPILDRLYFSPALRWVDDVRLSVFGRRNRALSKAEVWGRLAFCGFQVVAESTGSGEVLLVAKRTSPVSGAAKPSYYMVTSLEKVGLGGRPLFIHKVRTMFPFSEFLQKRVFEDHGLAATGKFANDFRLTDYGTTLRRYWLDELPQLYDWLRGDLKLVGMRATSRHFMSLYPRELYDIYIQVKPGLVPPIFGENTRGFDQIVEVEMNYLRCYWDRPMATDVRYLAETLSDIVFRGIRSK
jgi:lipopolysaccharide/colanic/teichoic acid biosynthesis glycosyltransferase